MRRASTLIELLVAMGVLSVLMLTTTRLLFAGDRAMGAETVRATQTGGAAELLEDIGRDVRAARSVSAGRGGLTIGNVHYGSDESGSMRTSAGQQTDRYPGVAATFLAQGRMVTIVAKTDETQIRTSFYRRN